MVFSVVLITLVLVADGYGGFDGLGEGDGGGCVYNYAFLLTVYIYIYIYICQKMSNINLERVCVHIVHIHYTHAT